VHDRVDGDEELEFPGVERQREPALNAGFHLTFFRVKSKPLAAARAHYH
jgi:hypothetical protein